MSQLGDPCWSGKGAGDRTGRGVGQRLVHISWPWNAWGGRALVRVCLTLNLVLVRACRTGRGVGKRLVHISWPWNAWCGRALVRVCLSLNLKPKPRARMPHQARGRRAAGTGARSRAPPGLGSGTPGRPAPPPGCTARPAPRPCMVCRVRFKGTRVQWADPGPRSATTRLHCTGSGDGPPHRVCSSVTSRRRLSSQNCALVHISRARASSAAPRSAACAPSSALHMHMIYINFTVGYGPVYPPKGCSVHVRAEGSCVQLRLHGVAGRMPFMRDSSSIRDD